MSLQLPNEKHERLNAFVGTWITTITMIKAGSDGEVSQAKDTYKWVSNGFFLQHDVEGKMSGQPFHSVEITGVGSDDDGYLLTSYDANGSINTFTGKLNGHRWEVTGSVQRFIGVFSDDWQILSYEWDQREDNRWSPLMTVTLKRQGGPI